MSKPTQNNPEQLKIYNSPIYRKKIKRMVEMVKTGYGIHNRLSRGQLPRLKSDATGREREAREKLAKHRLTIDTIHYFAQPLYGHGSATSKTSNTSTEAVPTENNELQAVS